MAVWMLVSCVCESIVPFPNTVHLNSQNLCRKNIQWRGKKVLFGFGPEVAKDEPKTRIDYEYQFGPAKNANG